MKDQKFWAAEGLRRVLDFRRSLGAALEKFCRLELQTSLFSDFLPNFSLAL